MPKPIAAAFSPSGDMVAIASPDEVVAVSGSSGRQLCRGRTWRLPKRVGVLGSQVVLFGKYDDVHADPPWEESTHATLFSFHYSGGDCELVQDAGATEACEDMTIQDAVALLLQDRGNATSVSRIRRDGGATLHVMPLNASVLINGRFSSDAQSALIHLQRGFSLPEDGRRIKMVPWAFADGREPQELPDVYGYRDWSFSDDGEVLVSLDISGPRFIDVATGFESRVTLDQASRRSWPNLTGDAYANLLTVSSRCPWEVGEV